MRDVYRNNHPHRLKKQKSQKGQRSSEQLKPSWLHHCDAAALPLPDIQLKLNRGFCCRQRLY